MASKQPAHSGSAQSKEIHINLVAEGIRRYSGPHYVLAVVSVGVDSTHRIEISAANEFDRQLDARIVDESVKISRIFCEGDNVHNDVPD